MEKKPSLLPLPSVIVSLLLAVGGVHPVTGAIAEDDCVIVAACADHKVTGAVAERDCGVALESATATVTGAVAEGDSVV